MIAPPLGAQIWIAAGATDLRRGFTGLSAWRTCVRASGVAHFAHLIWPTRILLFCSISPVGNLASPAGVEPSDARRAAP